MIFGKHDEANDLMVIARSPFNIYYEGMARVVSATNKVGDFDVLPGHADFFSMLTPGDVTVEPSSGDPVTFKANNGIITVRDNQVLLFVNM